MSYAQPDAGRVAGEASNLGRVPVWCFEDVEQRMVEAMRYWWRSPTDDARFAIGGRISSVWQQYAPSRRDLASWDMLKELPAPELRALPLSRADVARRDQASEWMAWVPERDRRLVALALTRLAAGDKQVPWIKLRRVMGIPFGADGLRKRYSRAITAIANQLNGPARSGRTAVNLVGATDAE